MVFYGFSGVLRDLSFFRSPPAYKAVRKLKCQKSAKSGGFCGVRKVVFSGFLKTTVFTGFVSFVILSESPCLIRGFGQKCQNGKNMTFLTSRKHDISDITKT